MTILAQGDQHVQKQIRKRSNADLSDIETRSVIDEGRR
ncbi:MAG: hypothetical protein RJA55_424 [Acidobacteriota bacterium]|jgi:hypothetical protein